MTEAVSRKKSEERVIELITPVIAPLGYEIVAVEIHNVSQTKKLRVFIDFQDAETGEEKRFVGIEDCVQVTRALDEPLDRADEIEALFKGPYELEVSSPGVDRPLRRARDYERFKGQEARIHVFRPLTGDEMENSGYQERNPKQKNFYGKLEGLRGDKVALHVPAGGAGSGSKRKGKKRRTATPPSSSGDEVLIPISLITKANLEPQLEILNGKKTS